VSEVVTHRALVDSVFRFDPESPFKKDTTAHYQGINWYPPNLEFYFQSKLYLYSHPENVIVFGTKGEQRNEIRYGYFILPYRGKEYNLNVYKESGSENLAVWFTDQTTGKETYNVGRYVDVGDQNPDSDHFYTIDFNNAYNPYCAYSSIYSCAIPRKEDHLDFPITAGEKKYHE